MKNFSNLKWYGKRKDYYSCRADVTVKVVANNCIQITFRYDNADLIGSKIDLAISDNCLVFRESADGYKTFTGTPGCTSRYIKIGVKNDFTKMLIEKFCGDYELKHDKESGLYYIEKE